MSVSPDPARKARTAKTEGAPRRKHSWPRRLIWGGLALAVISGTAAAILISASSSGRDTATVLPSELPTGLPSSGGPPAVVGPNSGGANGGPSPSSSSGGANGAPDVTPPSQASEALTSAIGQLELLKDSIASQTDADGKVDAATVAQQLDEISAEVKAAAIGAPTVPQAKTESTSQGGGADVPAGDGSAGSDNASTGSTRSDGSTADTSGAGPVTPTAASAAADSSANTVAVFVTVTGAITGLLTALAGLLGALLAWWKHRTRKA